MDQDCLNLGEVGLEVTDAQLSTAQALRRQRSHSVALQLETMERIARAFVQKPEIILQELVDAAVVLCGADSAGISVEKEDRTDQEFYRWVATAGQYSDFLGAVLPRYPSACGVCLDRGRPQSFRVGQRFFDIMGLTAPLVTDGILLPWEASNSRGTIFVMAHGRTEAFDEEDTRTMQVLANFAAMAVKQQEQQKLIVEQERAAAAAAMANELAHHINNPLQSLTNVLFLAAQGHHGDEGKAVGRAAMNDLDRLSSLVKRLLALPLEINGANPSS